jgi:peptidoglycan/LPS O-acetylase OafA/YrhL
MLGVAFAFLWIDFTAARDAGADHWCVNLFASNRRRRLTAPVAALFGASFFLLALTAYGAQPAYHDGGLPKFWDVAYLALSRSAWCVGLLLLCFLLFQGFGVAVRALLENRVMAVLSRLTFAAYLVHPALIFLVFQDQPLPIHYSTIWYVRVAACGWVGG